MPFRVIHLDASSLNKARKSPIGGAIIPAVFSRVGVFKYVQPDGSVIREYRPPDEVLDAESVESLKGVPVTFQHPEGTMVTPENFRDYARGFVHRDTLAANASEIKGDVQIDDAELLTEVDAGLRQISPGYFCETDVTPGVSPEGEPFDVVQRKIRYNHVALVKKGRQGDAVSLRLDSAGDCVTLDASQGVLGGTTHSHASEGLTVDEIEIEFEGKVYRVKNTGDAARLSGALVGAKARRDAIEGENKALEAKYKAEIKALEAKLSAALRYDASDAEIMAKASAVLGADFKPEGKTAEEIKAAVVAAKFPSITLEGKSPEYVAGLFDSIVVEADAAPDAEKTVEDMAESAKPEDTKIQGKADSAALVHRAIFKGAEKGFVTDNHAQAYAQKAFERGRKPLV